MQKRYQVFVSSTFDDLKEERSKVITALLDLGHIPCGMEYFPAADEDAWNCIERLIPQCDYYVVLVAGRYGCIPDGDSKSYTHKEYELAIANDVPVLGLLHAKPGELPRKHCESDPKVQKKLDQFRAQVKRKLCRFWTTADQIPGELLASLTHQISRIPRTGWVRADTVASDEAKTEIISLRKKLEKSESQVALLKKAREDQEATLASGDDEMRLSGTLLNIFAANSIYEDDSDDDPRPKAKLYFDLVSTWNMLLRYLGSRKKDWNLRDLSHWMSDEAIRSFENNSGVKLGPEFIGLSVTWNSGEITKLTNQLHALGMIVPRSYPEWSFTQKGLLHASRQLALRKGEVRSGDLEWCRVELIGQVNP